MTGRFFLVDENISPAIADQLWRRQPKMKVVKIGDEMAPPKGTLDPDILSWIELHGFSLVTRNRKSMPNHLELHLKKGHHVPGIFILRPNVSLEEALDDLILIWETAEADEYQDQIIYIPL